jgi:UDP-N-acetyl-D-glucosamine dehydrogenase
VLNDAGHAVRGARIVILGVSYKPGVGDTRESPALKMIELLRDRGALLVYHDDHVPALPALNMVNTPIDEALAGADLAVIVTAHPEVDHDALTARVPLMVDLRGVTRGRRAVRL